MIRFSKYILISFLAPIIASCAGNNINSLIDKDLKRAGEQLSLMSERFDTAAVTPRSWDNGVYKLLPKDWTCGFFPVSIGFIISLQEIRLWRRKR